MDPNDTLAPEEPAAGGVAIAEPPPDTAPAAEPALADASGGEAVLIQEEEEERKRRRLIFLLFLVLVLLGLLTILTFWYLLYRRPISDLLPPTGQNSPPHYLFSVYGASKPMGVAVTSSGDRIYVTESTGDKVVRIFDAGGQALGTLKPPSDNLPHTPVYVALDPRDGDVYVSDRATGAIYVYDSAGRSLRSFTPKQAIEGWQPLGMALSPDGLWWVTDLSSPYHRIEVFGQDGTLKRMIGTRDEYDYPNTIAFDKAGNAYVSDANHGRLVVLDGTGKQLATVGRGASPGNLGLPRGVATDDTGRLYVVDATGQFVHLYRVGSLTDWRPTFVDQFGSQGIGDGQFEYPNGIATDGRDRVYVTDRENNRVQVWGY